MLLIKLEIFKVDDKYEKNDEIKKSYLIVKRDKREDFVDVFDREITSIYDIEFFDVVVCNANDANEKTNEKNEVINAIVTNDFDFFTCFVRTCSCNLMLFSNLIKQRLHV